MGNFKVKCLEAVKDNGFTTGKIYTVENGRIIDDDGNPRPLLVKRGLEPIKSVEDIRDYKKGNWSWIGQFENWQSIFSKTGFYPAKM